MAYRQLDRALRAEVFEAVQKAMASGSNQSKSSIVANFVERGVSRATLYGWITRDMEDIAKGLVFQLEPPPDGEPVAAGIGAMVERGAVALANKPTTAISYQQRLHESLLRGDVIRAMGYGADGQPRNIRLIMDADEGERKKLQTAAIIQEKIAAGQREMHERFMDEILDVILTELPDRRARLLQRIDEVRAKYGSR